MVRTPNEQRRACAEWLAANRSRIVAVLANALGVPRKEVLRRLALASLHDLRISIAETPMPSPRRARGRPPRVLDRAAVVRTLVEYEGVVRAAARALQCPRTTLDRFILRERVPEYAWSFGQWISEPHARLLHESGVRPAVAQMRGYLTVPDGLVVPIWNVYGEKVWTQVRLDQPKKNNQRYRNDRAARPIVDVSPAGRALVVDSTRPLYVTEGPRKADAAVSKGVACVAMVGVRMLCFDDAQWRAIGLAGREVVLVFDADVATNPEVARAEAQLATYLVRQGARVSCARLRTLPGRPTTGFDDWLAAGHAVADLPENALARYPDRVARRRVGFSGRGLSS